MSKKFGPEFPILATLFQKLEKEGGSMQSGDVLLRQSLECIAPFHGERSQWFGSVSQKVGIPKTRVKSLFYNRQCRVWGDELARINKALSKASQSQAIEITNALNANAAARERAEENDRLKKEIKGEIMEDFRALLLEFFDPADGVAIRRPGASSHRH